MYAFFEFKIKVRLRRSAWHGYRWCVRNYFIVSMVTQSYTCKVHWPSEYQAWENSQHFTKPPLISLQNYIWEMSTEIPHWWCVTTQIWHHLYGISLFFSQMSFCWKTSCGIIKCWLFSKESKHTNFAWEWSMFSEIWLSWHGTCSHFTLSTAHGLSSSLLILEILCLLKNYVYTLYF